MPYQDRMSFLFVQDAPLRKETMNLVNTVTSLHIPQKTLALALKLFHIVKQNIRIEPDDVVLNSACISMACKISEIRMPLMKILQFASKILSIEVEEDLHPLYFDSIQKTEIDICLLVDFDFMMPDPYECLETVCQRKDLPTSYRRVAWIILNDITLLPVSATVPVHEIVYTCIFIQYLAEQSEKRTEIVEDRAAGLEFINWMREPDISVDQLILLSHAIISFYNL